MNPIHKVLNEVLNALSKLNTYLLLFDRYQMQIQCVHLTAYKMKLLTFGIILI